MSRKGEVTLVVVKSTTTGSGLVRVPDLVMETLVLRDCDFVEVSNWSGSVRLQVRADTIYSEDRIRMKEVDMHSLGLEEGDRVRVRKMRVRRKKKQ